jgi:hypothetical protein
MGSFSEIHARISELIEAEAQMSVCGWTTFEALPHREAWQVAFEDLNTFFSPLEIRQMMVEVENV